VVWSFVYLALCRLVQLVVLLCRSTNTNTQPEIDQFPYPRTSQALRHFHIFKRFTRARVNIGSTGSTSTSRPSVSVLS
jgi:hypothetical protein